MSCAPGRNRLSPLPSANIQNGSSQSHCKTGHLTHIPGDPAVSLHTSQVHAHLSNELETPPLDELYHKFWLVSKKSGYNIDALHRQAVKGRTIIPAQDPNLHMVWSRDKIYIKPVPVFLLNHDFWTIYLRSPKPRHSSGNSSILSESSYSVFHRSVATGFLRSYAFLITSQLDFTIAKESYLIPNDVDWFEWSKFICHFRHIGDESVASRYHYGQLRLSRLHWAVRIFRPPSARSVWFYQIPYWSITEFVAKSTIPLVFVFASVSLLLSSMQVALAVSEDGLKFQGSSENGIRRMNKAFWVFSIAVVLLWVVVWALLLGIPLVVLGSQLVFALRNRKKS